jgi:ATP-dependent exoDNAse (exonuclease V) beta subunit
MDEEERLREREETKRLLYVALTRARDRLYLGSVLKDGAFVAGRGSLAEVLPDTLRALFVRAAQASGEAIEWTAASGHPYRFMVCAPPPDVPQPAPVAGTAEAVSGEKSLAPPAQTTSALARLTIATSSTVVDARRALAQHAETAALVASGEAVFDVPFSAVEPGGTRIVRGAIDCLVRHADGSVTVFAVESGTPCAAHDERLSFLLGIARSLFPSAVVNGRTLYWNQ